MIGFKGAHFSPEIMRTWTHSRDGSSAVIYPQGPHVCRPQG
jgi:hypothetical protein